VSECELSNEELTMKVRMWVDELCRTGGKGWSLQVPVNMERDPDILISELFNRFDSVLAPYNAVECAHQKVSVLRDMQRHKFVFVCDSCGEVIPGTSKITEQPKEVKTVPIGEQELRDAKPGGSTPSQYALPQGAAELQDLIEFREMNFAMGNIFKACYRKKDAVDRLYDIRKIIWFAQREEQRLMKEE